MAEKSRKENLGARGLKTTLEEYLLDIMFEAPEYNNKGVNKIFITEKYFNSKDLNDNIFENVDIDSKVKEV